MKTGLILDNGGEEAIIQTKNKEQGIKEKLKYKPERRSKGILQNRRIPNKWPKGQEFRILSIDGGGIKGIFSSLFLEKLESHYLKGQSIVNYFDLICGTSTGGIIALGLGAGMKASEISKLYIEKGKSVFQIKYKKLKKWIQYFDSPYSINNLQFFLKEIFKEKKLKSSQVRLCIPSFEGRYSEVYVFKTPHHLDFKKDGEETMVKVALSTASAPTFFKPFRDRGYIFVDGGVWTNNPCMIGLVEALSSFDVRRENVKILSIGCGEIPYIVKNKMITKGGIWHWRKIIKGAMHLQSMNAIGQTGLLIGRNHIVRVDVSGDVTTKNIELDDWKNSMKLLPIEAEKAFLKIGKEVKNKFLYSLASPYKPFY